MILCVIVYVLLLAGAFQNKKEALPTILTKREWKRAFFLLLGFTTAALVLFVLEEQEQGGLVQRNKYGEGSRQEEYLVSIDGELDQEPIAFEVEEKEYTSEQVSQMFEEVMRELDQVILGKNETKDRIEHPLHLVTDMEKYPVEIQWELDVYDVIDTEGKILESHKKDEGSLVELRGHLFYKQYESIYVTTVKVYPEKKEGKELWIGKLQEELQLLETQSRREDGFYLPQKISGKRVEWSKESNSNGYLVLIFGFIVTILLYAKKKQDKKELEKKRQDELLRDYPEVLNKVILLLSTGAAMKQVWVKIVEDYERTGGKRNVYEEMKVTCYEMNSGITEAEAYERFGRRLKLTQYIRFGALLSQNLRKGSRGLEQLLKLECVQAFENRKSLAKKRGEEAGAKLLIPMFGMLAVVMGIVIVPAFLSIQL